MIELTDRDIHQDYNSDGFLKYYFNYGNYKYALNDSWNKSYILELIYVPDLKVINLLSKVKYKNNICELRSFQNNVFSIRSHKNIEKIILDNNKYCFVENGILYCKGYYTNGDSETWLYYYPYGKKDKIINLNSNITGILDKSYISYNPYLEKIIYKNKVILKHNNKFIIEK